MMMILLAIIAVDHRFSIFLSKNDKKLTVVNELSLEKYLMHIHKFMVMQLKSAIMSHKNL